MFCSQNHIPSALQFIHFTFHVSKCGCATVINPIRFQYIVLRNSICIYTARLRRICYTVYFEIFAKIFAKLGGYNISAKILCTTV